jgi:hypothetical protein
MQFKIFHGWYCPDCEAIHLNPDNDTEHEDWHESVDFVEYDKLVEWIEGAEDFGLKPEEIVRAIKNKFIVE